MNREQAVRFVNIVDPAWVVYLSDGGYSRLTLDLFSSELLGLDRGLALPRVVAAWDRLGNGHNP